MQHKGIQPRKVPASTNQISSVVQDESSQGRMPVDEQLRVSYGTIVEVNEDNSTVRVDIFERGTQGSFRLGSSKRNSKGAFIPLLEPLSEIHRRWGALRKGLGVRIFWRGKNKPSAESVAEIITDELPEVFKSGKKDPESNILNTAAYKIFSGGQSTSF